MNSTKMARRKRSLSLMTTHRHLSHRKRMCGMIRGDIYQQGELSTLQRRGGLPKEEWPMMLRGRNSLHTPTPEPIPIGKAHRTRRPLIVPHPYIPQPPHPLAHIPVTEAPEHMSMTDKWVKRGRGSHGSRPQMRRSEKKLRFREMHTAPTCLLRSLRSRPARFEYSRSKM